MLRGQAGNAMRVSVGGLFGGIPFIHLARAAHRGGIQRHFLEPDRDRSIQLGSAEDKQRAEIRDEL